MLLSVAATLLAGCATVKPCPPPALPTSSLANALIDGHCHLFNARDLSTVRFLSYVVAKHYPTQAALRALSPEDPDGVDLFMELVLAIAGADRAPSAVTELKLLQGRPLSPRAGEEVRTTDRSTTSEDLANRVAKFLGGKSFWRSSPTRGQQNAEVQLRRLIFRAAGDTRSTDARGMIELPPAELRAIAGRALSTEPPGESTPRAGALAGVYLPGLFEFVRQLEGYRHCLVDELAHLHRDDSRQNPLLMVPAMVDFGRWLRDDPEEGSTFVQQAAVWREIARRPGGPAVHGYVAYCPLRQVQFQRGRFGDGPGQIRTACGAANPLEFVEHALRHQGFIGAKVYPPMGFRAATNADRGPDDHPFPEAVLADVFGHAPISDAERRSMSLTLGHELDAALQDLFDKCAEIGAPVMAHGGNSVAANCHTGELADPFYWKPIFERSNAPPIMLAHFGGFSYWSADPKAPGHMKSLGARCDVRTDSPPFENTWEYWLASYLQKPENASKPIFADISYFSEALATDTAPALKNFKRLADEGLTVIKDHLVFGTDWVMLAQEKNPGVYSARVREFVRAAFGDAYVEPIMRTNFLRYADLLKRGTAFDRIASVYEGDALLTARLEAVRR
ncbi:hypothetical protein [Phenylobacterium sp.]|uniref:hypothetical protein n=1 Tax=Phenylobacterium sp. TaxID=1871053 RepID=UPI003567D067